MAVVTDFEWCCRSSVQLCVVIIIVNFGAYSYNGLVAKWTMHPHSALSTTFLIVSWTPKLRGGGLGSSFCTVEILVVFLSLASIFLIP